MKKVQTLLLALLSPILLTSTALAEAPLASPEAVAPATSLGGISEAWRIHSPNVRAPRPDAVDGNNRDGLPAPEVQIEYLSGSLVRLSWEAIAGADGYQVYFSTGDTPFLPWFIVGGTQLILDSSPGGNERQLMRLKLETLQ